MRLIDADALGYKVADLYADCAEETEGDKVVNRVINLIDDAPTVERPQGEWINLDGGDRACPFCNMGMSGESNASLVFFNYCPFCGADMRGVKND